MSRITAPTERYVVCPSTSIFSENTDSDTHSGRRHTLLYAMRCPGDIEGGLDMQPTFTSLHRSHAKSEKGFYIANDPPTSGSRE